LCDLTLTTLNEGSLIGSFSEIRFAKFFPNPADLGDAILHPGRIECGL